MTTIKTLCTKCLKPLELEWPDEMMWAGEMVRATDYLSKAILSKSVYVYCDECLDKMPDVRLDDLRCVVAKGSGA